MMMVSMFVGRKETIPTFAFTEVRQRCQDNDAGQNQQQRHQGFLHATPIYSADNLSGNNFSNRTFSMAFMYASVGETTPSCRFFMIASSIACMPSLLPLASTSSSFSVRPSRMM